MNAWIYIGAAGDGGSAAVLDLARAGAVWVPGNLITRVPADVHPGDILLLFWRPSGDLDQGTFLGAGLVQAPAQPWSEFAWLDTVGASHELFRLAKRLGYRGPRNYMTMARLEEWTEDPARLALLTRQHASGVRLDPGENYGPLPTGRFLLPADEAAFARASGPRPLLERITVDPDILGGKPTLRGLRIAVEHVLEWLESGASVESIVEEFPEIEREDVLAAIAYARRLVENERNDPAIGAA